MKNRRQLSPDLGAIFSGYVILFWALLTSFLFQQLFQTSRVQLLWMIAISLVSAACSGVLLFMASCQNTGRATFSGSAVTDCRCGNNGCIVSGCGCSCLRSS